MIWLLLRDLAVCGVTIENRYKGLSLLHIWAALPVNPSLT